jgi:hypothetical protein
VSRDISYLLRQWPFESEEFQVRAIIGDGGRELLQVRLDLGLIQMELTGRPDGTLPDGFESLLDKHILLAREAAAAGRRYKLQHGDCVELMREGVQYYYRYYAAFHLKRFGVVIRDTERNLLLFDFVLEHATRKSDKTQFEQYRPYVTMMRSRALAFQFLQENDYPAALESIDEGIAAIRNFLRRYDRAGDESRCSELEFLLRWRKELDKERPRDPVDQLRDQLDVAVAIEDYEEAAKLRDRIQRLRTDESSRGRL